MQLPENIHELVRKYNRPGPRYTSYPTAPHFREDVPVGCLVEPVGVASGPASLYIHIPFCEKNCWFCGCNTMITTRNSRADSYLDLLDAEARMVRNHIGRRKEIGQIHWGGGTPNFLRPGQIERLHGIVAEHFSLIEGYEFSVELAPNTLTQDQIDVWVACGLRRASFGVQDVQPEVQRAINRVQPMERNRWAMEALRISGVDSVNIDLVYGLPYQTPASYQDTLDQVLTLNPDRLAVFGYAHLPTLKPFQRKLEVHPMPDADMRIELLVTAVRTLTGAGYEYIGMDHFALPTDELAIARREGRLHRNFQGYTVQEGQELIGLGISSISETPLTYRQNHKAWAPYAESLRKGTWPVARGIVLEEEDDARRWMIYAIMCRMILDPVGLHRLFPAVAGRVMLGTESAIQQLVSDGLLLPSGDVWRVTELGRLFLRNLGMIFDARLDPEAKLHSRTV